MIIKIFMWMNRRGNNKKGDNEMTTCVSTVYCLLSIDNENSDYMCFFWQESQRESVITFYTKVTSSAGADAGTDCC